jgi:hypothetical protein
MDAILRLALSLYPIERRGELELLFRSIRQRWGSPVKQLQVFRRIADSRRK